MLRTYEWRGSLWQFADGHAPADAVLSDASGPSLVGGAEQKAAPAPQNKARRPRDKATS